MFYCRFVFASSFRWPSWLIFPFHLYIRTILTLSPDASSTQASDRLLRMKVQRIRDKDDKMGKLGRSCTSCPLGQLGWPRSTTSFILLPRKKWGKVGRNSPGRWSMGGISGTLQWSTQGPWDHSPLWREGFLLSEASAPQDPGPRPILTLPSFFQIW